MQRYLFLLLCIVLPSLVACTDTPSSAVNNPPVVDPRDDPKDDPSDHPKGDPTDNPGNDPRSSTAVLEPSVVAGGLDTPWEILWGPDGWIWMTERPGRVSRVDPETGEMRPLLTLSDVYEEDYEEHGLLGMALHPDFANTPHVFLIYNYRPDKSQHWLKLVRYTYDGSTLTNPVTMIDSITGNAAHDGSRLMIGPDRKLYITTGDATDWGAPQDNRRVNGKVLRINLDGSVPADNPFVAQGWPACLVWSRGHRNAQGLVFAPNGRLYASEHGPGFDDEINIITRGGNYGWPDVQGRCDGLHEGGPHPEEMKSCADLDAIEPIHSWGPTRAIAGMDFYNHAKFPEWKNSLLVTTLKANELRVLKLSEDGSSIVDDTPYFEWRFGRLRDLCISPEGRIFIATSNADGRGTPQPDRIIEIRSIPRK